MKFLVILSAMFLVVLATTEEPIPNLEQIDGYDFEVESNEEGSNYSYDCASTSNKKIYIAELDTKLLSLKDIRTLTIKNCENVTLDHKKNSLSFLTREVTIILRGIENLNLEWRCSGPITIWTVEINNLRFTSTRNKIKALYVKNVGISKWSVEGLSLSQFLMAAVKGNFVNLESEFISATLFSVRDSHFSSAFNLKLQGNEVEIFNNSFETMGNEALLIRANKSFTFADNYVKESKSAFSVVSPIVNIVYNTFRKISSNPMKYVRVDGDEDTERVLNITQNIFDSVYDKDFPRVDELSKIDVLVIKENLINCSCKNSRLLGHISSGENLNFLQEVLSLEINNNSCIDSGKCPLSKISIFAICQNINACPVTEPEKPSENSQIMALLQSIKEINLSALKELSTMTKHQLKGTEDLLKKENSPSVSP